MNDYSSYSDEYLVESIKSSNVDAFKVLYYRYYENLYHFLCLRTNSIETAKDFIQEIFTRVWQNRGDLDKNKSIKAYLFRIANNLVIDRFRKRRSRQDFISQTKKNVTDNSLESITEINLAINKLPEKLRIIFILSRYHGFKYSEIAQTCNISVKTVESRMSQALKILRDELS